MKCPHCSGDTRVMETRRLGQRQYRYRRCDRGHDTVTVEQPSAMTVERFRHMEYINRAPKEAI